MFPNCPTPPLKKDINLRGYLTKNFRACGVVDTACTIFAFKNLSYLGEFEAEFKKGIKNQGKITQGQKSCDTVPLKGC
jgi:hypothetical protein